MPLSLGAWETTYTAMKLIALLALAAPPMLGCKPDGPLGALGAIVTAPVTVPVMFVFARLSDMKDHLERAKRNDRPLSPIDARSKAMAGATLEEVLERGAVDEGH